MHWIIFGRLLKPNIRILGNFAEYSAEAECDAVFCRILSIRHIEMLPVEEKINKHWTLNSRSKIVNTSYELLNIILLALNFPVHNYFIITKVVSWCNRNNEVKLTWSLFIIRHVVHRHSLLWACDAQSLFKYTYKTSMIHYRLANRSVSSFHKNK